MSDSQGNNFNFSAPGLGKTGQYQMSGIPFTTASIAVPQGGTAPTEVTFPYVTKFVTVSNLATGSNKPLRVGFSSLGTTGSSVNQGSDNFFVLDNGETYTGEFRVASVFLLGAAAPFGYGEEGVATTTTASVIAGMTGINATALRTNWSGTSGVG
tara:strand:+ start:350 stop:814 length:465 start_codon:yes stop_codon:yes gene_type:complete